MPPAAKALSLTDLQIEIAREPPIVQSSATVMVAIAQMDQAAEGGGYVVGVKAERVVGLLTERDVVRLVRQHCSLDAQTLDAVLTQPVVTLPETALSDGSLDSAAVLALFQRHGIRHIPILDNQDRLAGVLTQEAVQQAILQGQLSQALAEVQAQNLDTRINQSQVILDAIPDLMFRVGADGCYRGVISPCCGFDMIPDSIDCAGQPMASLLPPVLAERQHHYLHRALETGELQVYEQQVEVKDRLQDEEVRVMPCGEDEVLFIIRNISEQKQAERALRQSEQTYRTLVETLPDLLIQMDREGHYKHMAGGSAVHVKYPAEPSVGLDIYNVLSPEEAERRLDYTHQALETGDLQIYEQIFDLEGSQFQEEVRIAPLNDQAVLILVRDITAQKQLEAERDKATAALSESERRFRTLFENTPKLAMQGYDRDRRVIYWNSASEQLYGYSKAEAMGQPIEELIVPLEARSQIVEMLDAGATGVVDVPAGEMELATKDGTKLTVFSHHISFANRTGEPEFYCVNLDLGPLKQVEQQLQQLNQSLETRILERTAALQEREQFLQTVLDTFPLSVFWKDRESRHLGCNRNFLRDSGLASVADIIGKTDDEMPWAETEAEAYRADDRQVIESETAKIGIIEPQTPVDGKQIWLETNKLPPRNLAGDVIGVLGTYQDITERRQAQALLQASEARYRALIEVMPDFMMRLHADGTCLDVVPGEGIKVLSPDVTQIGRNIYDSAPHDHAQRLMEHVHRALQIGEIQIYDYELLIDGTLWAEEARVIAINEEEALVIVRDITERKRAEAQLRRYERIVSAATDGVAMVDRNYIYQVVNQTYSNRTGTSQHEIVGHSVAEFLGEANFRLRSKPYLDGCLTGETFQYQDWFDFQGVGRRFLNVSYAPYREVDGTISGVVVGTCDVTDQKRLEQQLQQTSQKLQTFVENAPAAISCVDRHGCYLQVNQAAVDFLGIPAEDMVGRSVTDFFPEAQAHIWLARIQTVLETQQPLEAEDEVNLGDKTLFFQSILFAIFDDEGEASSFWSIATDITARKQTEVKVREISQRLALATNSAQIGVWDFDPIQNRLIWDERMYALYGISPESFGGAYEAWQQRLHPDDLLRVDAEIQTALAGEGDFHTEFRVVWPDGQVRFIEAHAIVLRDDAGNPQRVIGVNWDISDRKQAETDLKASRAYYQAIVSDQTELICRFLPDGTLTFVNEAYCAFFQKSSAELLGHSFIPLFPEEDRDIPGENFSQLSIDHPYSTCEHRVIAPDGSIHWQQWTDRLLFDAIGNCIEIQAVGRDITPLKEAELAFRESEARWQFALEGAGDGLWDWNLQTDRVFFSPQWKAMLGFSDTDIGNTLDDWKDRVHPDDIEPLQNFLQQYFRGEVPIYEYEHRMRCKDGSYKWILARGKVMAWDNGQPLRMIGTHKDISASKQAELILQQENAFRRQIVEGMAEGLCVCHEVTTFPFIHFTVWNPQMEAITGYTQAEINCLGWYQTLYPDSEIQGRAIARMERMRQGDNLIAEEWQIQRQDQQQRTISISTSMLSNHPDQTFVLALIQDVTTRKQTETTLQNLAAATTTGQDFFSELVGHIAEALEVPYVMVTEKIGNTLRTLAFWADGVLQPNFSYPYAQTPCERTLEEGLFYCEGQVQQYFPNDIDLVTMEAETYLGIALQSSPGQQPLGELCLLDKTSLQKPHQAEQLLKIFAARATAELQRQQATSALEQLNNTLEARVMERTEALLAREVRYQTLMEGASDAILVMDCQGNVIEANHQAERLLGYPRAQLTTFDLVQFRPPEEDAQVRSTFEQINSQVHSRLLDVMLVRQDGSTVSVDVSASVIDIHGETIVQAILRDISDYKRLEAQRQEAEQELQRLVQELSEFKLALDQSVIVATTDAKGMFTYVNDRFCEISGYDRAELLGKTHRVVNSEYHSANFIAELWRTLRNGEIWRGELCNRSKQGQLYWVDSTLVPFLDEQGQPCQYLTIRFDITDRKRADQIIRQQAKREKLLRETGELIRQSLDLPTIFDTACEAICAVLQADRVGIFKFDPETQFTQGEFVAESAVGEFGSILGISVKDHCFGEDYIALYTQGRFLLSDNIYDKTHSPCHIDILAQFQIRACMVIPLLCGETLWGLLCIHQCSGPRHWHMEEVGLTQRLAIQLAIAIQQASLYEQLQQELAQRQQAQQQLTERNQELALSNQELARATRLKDEFLANMSHELRTPLNAILGMTEALQDQVFGIVTPEQIKALQTVERGGTHLLALINDILDVAKIEAGQVNLDCKVTAVGPLCKSSLAFVKQQAQHKNIQLETQLAVDLPDLWVDERRIRQVLINLLNNAVKFTPEGGRVILEVSQQGRTMPPVESPELEEITRVQGDRTSLAQALNLRSGEESGPMQTYLCIAVVDTGIGIAPSDLPRLFQPFTQIDSALNRQYNGTGLGLALVKRLVELHGGQVGVKSQPGIGSRFTIQLPCASRTLSGASATTPGSETTITQADGSASLTSPLILLAEDNEANVRTLSSYLHAKGYRILMAKDGREAIAMAQAEHPDLILMDVQMPNVDGLTAMEQIRQDPVLVNIPIIALTALAMAGDCDRCLAAGATAYLTKPVKLKQLVNTIQQLLNAL